MEAQKLRYEEVQPHAQIPADASDTAVAAYQEKFRIAWDIRRTVDADPTPDLTEQKLAADLAVYCTYNFDPTPLDRVLGHLGNVAGYGKREETQRRIQCAVTALAIRFGLEQAA